MNDCSTRLTLPLTPECFRQKREVCTYSPPPPKRVVGGSFHSLTESVSQSVSRSRAAPASYPTFHSPQIRHRHIQNGPRAERAVSGGSDIYCRERKYHQPASDCVKREWKARRWGVWSRGCRWRLLAEPRVLDSRNRTPMQSFFPSLRQRPGLGSRALLFARSLARHL